ncbi:L-asparaginase [Pleomassaria siparia CBS 279.74]|uniref:asparaginase n=1 Tax=Pleomassaria siparia CBS 279.74 TaxID=1314801 RepID=A0A6G1K7Y0_9PLEO|nr:L-asparaginase [Pleomassaria siparia CBS 279.74]
MFFKSVHVVALSFTYLALAAPIDPAAPLSLVVRDDHFPDLIVRQDIQSPINASLPNVTIFATGGTIASQGSTNTQTVGYQVGLGVQQLVDAVPEILNFSNINGYQISNVDSGSINETISLKLAHMINEELAKPEISGVVITHGTDTLEETAFFLESTVNSTKPVVIVGAMRPATALSADGPLNLLQAVTLACSENAKGRGVMVTLNDRIGGATYTTKNNANTLDTFFSTEAGQLGVFINQVPFFFYEPAQPVGRVVFNVSTFADLARVDILYAYQDMDPQLFNASFAAGAQGIVYAGVGAGGMSRVASLAAEELYNVTGIPIVASHRSTDGFVPSSDTDFTIASGFYNPQKARVLTQLALTAGYTTGEIRDIDVAKSVYTHAASILAPTILNHSIRVYLYAKMIAEHTRSIYATGTRLDLLFTACLFHDIGTTQEYNGSQRFEVEGGDAAVTHLTGLGVSKEHAHEVWMAISLHTSAGIAERINELTGIVREAVLFDFGRPRAHADVLLGSREEFEKRFERGSIEKELGDAVVDQAVAKPDKAPSASWPGVLYRAHLAEPEWDGVNRAF